MHLADGTWLGDVVLGEGACPQHQSVGDQASYGQTSSSMPAAGRLVVSAVR